MQKTTGYIKWSDYQGLLENLEKDGKTKELLLMTIGVTTALRIGDILKLKWSDLIDSDGKAKKILEFREKKTGKVRRIPIDGKPAKIIKNIWEDSKSRPTSYVFESEKYKKGEPISVQYVNKWLKQILSEYGVECTNNVSSHLFRKTFGRRLLETSEDKTYALLLLMDIFKHTSLDITKRYIGIREDEIRTTYKQIWA